MTERKDSGPVLLTEVSRGVIIFIAYMYEMETDS